MNSKTYKKKNQKVFYININRVVTGKGGAKVGKGHVVCWVSGNGQLLKLDGVYTGVHFLETEH